VTGLVLAGGVVLASWLGPLVIGGGGGGGELRLAGASSVVVEPGDTLWSIALAVAGAGDDVRVVVDRIEELNGLGGPDLVPGQVLELP
jgi:nucleoid-associated protein YgaU